MKTGQTARRSIARPPSRTPAPGAVVKGADAPGRDKPPPPIRRGKKINVRLRTDRQSGRPVRHPRPPVLRRVDPLSLSRHLLGDLRSGRIGRRLRRRNGRRRLGLSCWGRWLFLGGLRLRGRWRLWLRLGRWRRGRRRERRRGRPIPGRVRCAVPPRLVLSQCARRRQHRKSEARRNRMECFHDGLPSTRITTDTGEAIPSAAPLGLHRVGDPAKRGRSDEHAGCSRCDGVTHRVTRPAARTHGGRFLLPPAPPIRHPRAPGSRSTE